MKRIRSSSPCNSIYGLLLSDEEDQSGDNVNGLNEPGIETENPDSIKDDEDIELDS